MPLIEVDNLCKEFRVAKHHRGTWGAVRNLFSSEYRVVCAVEDVSFSIEAGELVGYLGPNGAGKSTTIKILTGILVPSSGAVHVAGRVPWNERIDHVRGIGVVFGQRTNLWWDLPVIESLDLLRNSAKYWALMNLSARRSDRFHWANACAPIWPERCCTIRRSSSSTNRRSD